MQKKHPTDPFFISVFLQEIIYQCKCIEDCYNELLRALEKVSEHERTFKKSIAQKIFKKRNMREVLNLLNSDDEKKRGKFIEETRENTTDELMNEVIVATQNKGEKLYRKVHRSIEYLVNHSGALSFLIFPSKTNSSKFKKLRGRILRAITKTNEDSIIADRSLRNSYQHYDERLDEMLKLVGAYSHRNISSNSLYNERQSGSFSFDPEKVSISFPKRDGIKRKEYDLNLLFLEVNRIEKLTADFREKLSELELDGGKKKVKSYIENLIQ